MNAVDAEITPRSKTPKRMFTITHNSNNKESRPADKAVSTLTYAYFAQARGSIESDAVLFFLTS